MLQAIYNFLTNYEFGSPFWAQHKRKKLKSLYFAYKFESQFGLKPIQARPEIKPSYVL